jgi:hypothetical protein
MSDYRGEADVAADIAGCPLVTQCMVRPYVQKVYRSVKQPMSRRLRAAIEALPHEHPRLGAVAIGSMNAA